MEPETVKTERVKGVDKWEAENAADTITRAFEIRDNKRLKAAALTIIARREKAAKKAKGWAGGLQ